MSRPIIAAEIQYKDLNSSPVGATTYLASEAFVTADADTLSNQYFAGRLDGDVNYSLRISTVFWGSKSAVGIGSIEVINDDGGLDGWVDLEFRDQTITIKQHNSGDSYDSASTLLTAIIERIEIVSEKRLRIVIRDPAAALLAPMQTASYGGGSPVVDAEGVLKPICFGTPLRVSPVQVDANALEYNVHDAAIQTVTQVYDQGVEVDFSPTTNGFTLVANPAGKITANPVTSGTGTDPTLTVSPTEYVVSGGGRSLNMFDDGISPNVSLVYGMSDISQTRAASSGGKFYFEMVVDDLYTHLSGSSGVTYGDAKFDVTVGLSSAAISNPQDPKDTGFYCLGVGHRYTAGTNYVGLTAYGNNVTLDDLDNFGDTTAVGDIFGVKVDFDSSPMTIEYLKNNTQPDAVYGPWGIADGTYAPVLGATHRTRNNKATIRLTEADFTYSIPVGYAAWSTGITSDTGFQDFVDSISSRVSVTFDTDSPSTVGTIDALGYNYSYYYTEPITAGDLLSNGVASFGGFWYVSRLAEIKVGQLKTVASSFLTLTDVELLDAISLAPDLAKGLSDGIGSRKNWSVHRESEVAGSVTELFKQEISREYGTEYRTATAMAGEYVHAVGAPLHATLLTTDTDASTEADRFAALYSERHNFWSVKIALSTGRFTTLLDNIGNGVVLSIDRFGLSSSAIGAFSSGFETAAWDAGSATKVFSLIGVEGSFLKNEITMTLWG